MFNAKMLIPLIAFGLGGCGLGVPELQENPGDVVGGQQLVESIVYNVTCEVQDAIDAIYNNKDHPVQSIPASD